jgi:hypothetical protein
MHGRVHEASIIVVTLNVSRAIIPIDSHRLYSLLWVIVDVDKLHDPAEIVGLAGRLANEVHLVWKPIRNR